MKRNGELGLKELICYNSMLNKIKGLISEEKISYFHNGSGPNKFKYHRLKILYHKNIKINNSQNLENRF